MAFCHVCTAAFLFLLVGLTPALAAGYATMHCRIDVLHDLLHCRKCCNKKNIYISDVPCRVSAVRVGACYVVSAAVRVEAPRVRVGIWQCVLILHGRVLGFGSAC